ncbi:hypothetical protein ABW19_dt0205631 [Dactylella cylindrospora]|nr:hypothetical protein ABW19_dt0205631 [Dactylella cylindrospora]
MPPIIVGTYTPDGRELRSSIDRYIPEIFKTSNWTEISPLMWSIEPRMSAGKPLEKSLRPRIIVIEIPGKSYMLYRFFQFAGHAYGEFLASLARLTPMAGIVLSDKQVEFLSGGSDSQVMQLWIRQCAGEIKNGDLSAEVRYAHACCERGLDMCTMMQGKANNQRISMLYEDAEEVEWEGSASTPHTWS